MLLFINHVFFKIKQFNSLLIYFISLNVYAWDFFCYGKSHLQNAGYKYLHSKHLPSPLALKSNITSGYLH